MNPSTIFHLLTSFMVLMIARLRLRAARLLLLALAGFSVAAANTTVSAQSNEARTDRAGVVPAPLSIPKPLFSVTYTPSTTVQEGQTFTANWKSTGAERVWFECTAAAGGYAEVGDVYPPQQGSKMIVAQGAWAGKPSTCKWFAENDQLGVATIEYTLTTNALPKDDADFVMQSAPGPIAKPGQTYPYNVTMINTGNTTWVAGGANPHRLALIGDPVFGNTRMDLRESVPPGKTGFFRTSGTIPPHTPPANYNFQWQMIKEGVGLFGKPTPAESITVAPRNDALYVTHTPPAANVKPGEPFSYSVTMRNNGTSTWTAGGAKPHRLGLASAHAFGPVRVELSNTVAPGQDGTFVVSTVVPTNMPPARYDSQWKMIQDNEEWFGGTTPVISTTVDAVNDAAFIAQTAPPASMKPGQAYSYSITMRNTGTSTWVGGNAVPHRLAATGSALFGPSRLELAGPVAPGADGVFTFNTTVPANTAPGQHTFQWKMVQDGVAYFGVDTPAQTITIEPLNGATYVSHTSPPANVKPGQQYSYSVTMRNTGTSTWIPGGATPHRLGLVSAHAFGPDRGDLAGAVAPGQDGTFVVSTTVPTNMPPGRYEFQWRALEQSREWFGPAAPIVSTIVDGVNDAVFVSQTAPPSTLKPGQAYSYTVTMRNIGTSTWVGGNAAPHRLASTGSPIFGASRIELAGPVAPGANGVFTFSTSLAANAAPGQHTFQWRMVQDNVAYFGADTPAQTITVLPFNGAEFVSQVPPASPVQPGKPVTYSVTMKNTGTTTWAAGTAHALGASNPYWNTKWGTDRILLNSPVAPGATHTFTFSGTLPVTSEPGVHNFQWQMMQDGLEWFGQPSENRTLTVAEPVNDAQFVSQVAPPETLIPGQPYTFSIKMRNSGTRTWSPNGANPHKLVTQSTLWGVQALTLASPVAPGEERTFTFSGTLNSATLPQTVDVQWRMAQDGVGTFGESSPGVTLTIPRPQLPGRVEYIHTDGLGSPVARTDQQGRVVSRTRYEPYGLTAAGAVPTIGFTGHVNDTDTGLVYMQQRYYDPVAGRFLSIDPVTTDANTGGSFNRYSYAESNPYKYVDPDGRRSCAEMVGMCSQYTSSSVTVQQTISASQNNNVPGAKDALPKEGEAMELGVNVILAAEGGVGLVRAGPGWWAQLMGFLGKEAADTGPMILYHYTTQAGVNGILGSRTLNPSLKALNPKDARYGNGQYLSDILPGTKTGAQLSREFLGMPFQGSRFTHYVAIDVRGLNVVRGRSGVFLVPNETELQLFNRIISSGRNAP